MPYMGTAGVPFFSEFSRIMCQRPQSVFDVHGSNHRLLYGRDRCYQLPRFMIIWIQNHCDGNRGQDNLLTVIASHYLVYQQHL